MLFHYFYIITWINFIVTIIKFGIIANYLLFVPILFFHFKHLQILFLLFLITLYDMPSVFDCILCFNVVLILASKLHGNHLTINQ